MGLSRNKVAVPEGAAGTPPFWSDAHVTRSEVGSLGDATIGTSWTTRTCLLEYKEKEEAEPQGEGLTDSPIAQLVRALH